jgi:hypothetical protein
MDKELILMNVASMTAEQLFEQIKAGKVTLEELTNTGNLDNIKRRKIISLLQQLDSIDDDDWEHAKYGNEVSLSDYITKHPAGKHVKEAKQKIDFFQMQRANELVEKEKILNKIQRDPNTYSPDQIIDLQKKYGIGDSDLLNCNIPASAIENLHNIVIRTLELGPTPTAIPSGFTEVYFWGATGSGKTCALGAVLQMAHKKGYLDLVPGTGYDYAHQLKNIFSDDGIANDYLPAPTPLEKTQYLPFTLKRPNERGVRSVSLIELSGEIFKCFYDKNAGRPFDSQSHVDTFDSLNSFLRNNNNRKIHFFFIDYNRENKPDGKGLSQSDYLSAASNYFKNNNIFGKSTDAIFVVLTKSDLLRDESGNGIPYEERYEYAKNYLNENNYQAFVNTLKDICRKEGINAGVLTIEPFSLGNVYFQKICDFDGQSAEAIVEILMARVPATRTSIFDFLNR